MSAMKYQIGSGLVFEQERIILSVQGYYLDLLTILSDVHYVEALNLPQETPASLLQMMQDWPFWRAALPTLVERWWSASEQTRGQSLLKADAIVWLPPLRYPPKLICLAINYDDHLVEAAKAGNVQRPRFPYCFLKPPTTTLIGSGETFSLSGYNAKMFDWEMELAVVIGQRTRHARGEAALASIAGYSIVNDLSIRDWAVEQMKLHPGLDWVMAKGFDGAAPMGPFITPAEFVQNPQALTMTLTVNGQIKQHASTASMIFSIQEIIEHLTAFMTLEPGDVIVTGSPAGIGAARTPPEFLRPGDRVIAEIEELGRLETVIQ